LEVDMGRAAIAGLGSALCPLDCGGDGGGGDSAVNRLPATARGDGGAALGPSPPPLLSHSCWRDGDGLSTPALVSTNSRRAGEGDNDAPPSLSALRLSGDARGAAPAVAPAVPGPFSSATTGACKSRSSSTHAEPVHLPFFIEKCPPPPPGASEVESASSSQISSNVVGCTGPPRAGGTLLSLSSFAVSSCIRLFLDIALLSVALIVSAASVMTSCSVDEILSIFMCGLHARYRRYASWMLSAASCRIIIASLGAWRTNT
jgi:hypothetical protein